MIIDYTKYTIKSILKRKLRSWLTMLGIFVGIAAVVALLSLSQGLQDAINEEFEKVGINRILVVPGGVNFGPFTSGITTDKLYEDDVKVVEKVSGVEVAIGAITSNGRVKFDDTTVNIPIFGFPTGKEYEKDINKLNPFELDVGREIRSNNEALIRHELAYETFDKDIHTGDTIEIEGREFKVVGIRKAGGQAGKTARVSKEVMKEIMDVEENEVSTIFILAKEGFAPSEVAEKIKKALRKHRNVKKDEEDFSVQTSEQIIKNLNQILDMVQLVLAGIAAISLIVGGIGILNTMYTAVLERRKEIGIMKAVGARNSDIFTVFLIESGILGSAGGVIGISLGFGFAKLVQVVALTGFDTTIRASFNPIVILSALLFSFIVGSVSGVLPAMQASRLKPIETLRSQE